MFLAILHMHRALEKIVGRQGVWADKVSKSLGQAKCSDRSWAVLGVGMGGHGTACGWLLPSAHRSMGKGAVRVSTLW